MRRSDNNLLLQGGGADLAYYAVPKVATTRIIHAGSALERVVLCVIVLVLGPKGAFSRVRKVAACACVTPNQGHAIRWCDQCPSHSLGLHLP